MILHVGDCYLFVMWDGGGNVNPFLALGSALASGGDRVIAVGNASLADRLEPLGIELVGSPNGWLAGADDVLDAVDEHRPDAIVVDYMLTGALCGAERSSIPTAALVHTLYRVLLLDGAPNPIQMAGSIADINDIRNGIGLEPIGSYGELLDATDLVMVAVPPELDEPGALPPHVAYVGAMFEGPGSDEGWQPPAGDGPLVVVSIGTAGNPEVQLPLLGKIVEGLGDLPVRGFVTVPSYIDESEVGSGVPDNVTVSGYVRHAAVLPHAELMVTHAGLGSVSAALAHGVRLVCLPLDREQPDNARAVARTGAGCALEPTASAREISAAITDQLARPRREPITHDPSRAAELVRSLPERHR